MKKFSFSLDTVFKYKNDVLEGLQNEYGILVNEVSKQEQVIEKIVEEYYECNDMFNQKKVQGISVVEALHLDLYLHQLEYDIDMEKEKLRKMQEAAEKKRLEVVEAKKETSTIEKLKEKKIELYNKDMRKNDELLVEEFVSFNRLTER